MDRRHTLGPRQTRDSSSHPRPRMFQALKPGPLAPKSGSGAKACAGCTHALPGISVIWSRGDTNVHGWIIRARVVESVRMPHLLPVGSVHTGNQRKLGAAPTPSSGATNGYIEDKDNSKKRSMWPRSIRGAWPRHTTLVSEETTALSHGGQCEGVQPSHVCDPLDAPAWRDR